MNTGAYPHKFDFTYGVYGPSDELPQGIGGAGFFVDCEFNGGEEVVGTGHWKPLSAYLDQLRSQKAPRRGTESDE